MQHREELEALFVAVHKAAGVWRGIHNAEPCCLQRRAVVYFHFCH